MKSRLALSGGAAALVFCCAGAADAVQPLDGDLQAGFSQASMQGGGYTSAGLGNGHSTFPDVSPNGRFIVFSSSATNLVPGDTNGKRDIFIRDTVARTTRRVSVSATGKETNQNSDQATVSNDGRYVAFVSSASNLVGGDTNGKTDVFRKDLVTGAVVRVSVGAGGKQGNNGANSGRLRPDGKAVVFSSLASNLVSGDTNGHRDVFIRDMVANTTRRISMEPSGSQVYEAYSQIDYSPDGTRIGWFSNWCGNATCSYGFGNLMVWSSSTGKSVEVASDYWSGQPFSIELRMGQNMVGVSSWGDRDGDIVLYSFAGTPLETLPCDMGCYFDLAAGKVGAYAYYEILSKFTIGGPDKNYTNGYYTWFDGMAITPDGSRLAFAGDSTPSQVCVWNTAGATATAVSVPSGPAPTC